MTLRLVAVAVAAGLLVLGPSCSSEDEPADTQPQARRSSVWPGPGIRPRAGRNAVAKFNEYLESQPVWGRSPLHVAVAYLGAFDPEAATTSVVVRRNAEGARRAVVSVTLDGLLDDSVRSVRYVLTLRRLGQRGWRLLSVSRTQRCAHGRGHQAFTPAPCF